MTELSTLSGTDGRNLKELYTVQPALRHAGTGRPASVLRVEAFWDSPPVAVPQGAYVLFTASERLAQFSRIESARAWIEAGASYVCAWGPSSPDVEETFDYAVFLPELGDPINFTLMTTNHVDEPLEEALWFAFHHGKAPDEVDNGACPVVVVVDSQALEDRCLAWVRTNTE